MRHILMVVIAAAIFLTGCTKKTLDGITVSGVDITGIQPISGSGNITNGRRAFFAQVLRERLQDAGLRFDGKGPLSIEGDVFQFSNGTGIDYSGEVLTSRISIKDANDLYEPHDVFGHRWPKRKYYTEGRIDLGFDTEVSKEHCERLAAEVAQRFIKEVRLTLGEQ